jgi:hypothetical protein
LWYTAQTKLWQSFNEPIYLALRLGAGLGAALS